jgi:hypothetical protein
MPETPALERLTAFDLFLSPWDDSSWSSDIDGLAILDGTRFALVSATTDGDGEQRLPQHLVGGAAAVAGDR